ncbi:ribonuclease P protein subunit Rpp30 isoform X2 [Dermacentor variabilis]|uniref:ribonuclease P protein subunit Rpp30 isoform X2 n=1 Tax=Dermacentor variabilis TaxID=34621 RepID=UPI003F5B703D
MDLNLIVQRESEKLDKSNVIKKIKTAFQLGYDVVALNVVIGASELGSKNKIPEPPQYSLTHPDLQPLTPRNRRLRILTRLTANLTDSAESHRLFQSPVAKKYDIIAVSVTQEKMFQHLCNQGEFDIVCLPLDDRLPFVVKRTQYGAGIIITSGAWMPQELRGPNDAANLGFLYGLSECTTREAVFGNCRSVIMHAETRRKVDRAIVFSKSVDELPEKDKWLVEACKAPGVEEAAAKAAGVGDSQKHGGPPPKKKKKKGHS